MHEPETAFGPTIEIRLEKLNILLTPASSPRPEKDLLVYALDKITGEPIDEKKTLDLAEIFHDFSILHTPKNPTGTLLAIEYGASSAIIQQVIDQGRMADISAASPGELSAKESEQYYRLLVYEVSRWEYVMDVDSTYIRAELTDFQRPLLRVLDHLNRLEIAYRIEHKGHSDVLLIDDEFATQHILLVRKGLYDKIAVHNPNVIDLARNLKNCRVLLYARVPSSADDDPGGEGEAGQ